MLEQHHRLRREWYQSHTGKMDLVTRLGEFKGTLFFANFSTPVRDLGFHFDDVLNFNVHVNQICRSVSYTFYRIRNILDGTRTERLILSTLLSLAVSTIVAPCCIIFRTNH